MDKSLYILPLFDIVHYTKRPLEEQCSLLEVPLIELERKYRGRPEPAVLKHYMELGYNGKHCEGSYIFLIIHALILEKLQEYNEENNGNRQATTTRPLKIQIQEMGDYLAEAYEEILNLPDFRFRNNVEEILCEKLAPETYPDVDVDFALNILGRTGRELLHKIACMLAMNPYEMFRGWPDLILVNDHELKFVEVKHKDRLTDTQLYTFYNLKRLISDISVVRISGKQT